jgi:hypothetical protein
MKGNEMGRLYNPRSRRTSQATVVREILEKE